MKFELRNKIAAVLALLIGTMSVVAGSRVLMGISTPGYPVLNWLVVYNVLAGILSIAISMLIWKKIRHAFSASIIVALLHIVILILLISVFSETVAAESIKAMIFRSSTWIIIVLLSIKTNNQHNIT